MREIEQAGLLGSFRYFSLKFVTGLPKVSFHAAPNGREAGHQRSKQHEDNKMRNIVACHRQTVSRFDEKIVEGEKREDEGKNRWPKPPIPSRCGEGKQEQRI